MLDISGRVIFEEAWNFLSTIPSAIRKVEAETLFTLVQENIGLGEAVEIGSEFGVSTSVLALGSKVSRSTAIYAVDHHLGNDYSHLTNGTWDRFILNLERVGVKEYVIPVRMSSEEAVSTWTRPIRLLFIDGNHRYECIKFDFDRWFPFVIPEGYVILHDYLDRDLDVGRFIDTEAMSLFSYTKAVGVSLLARK